MVATTGPTAYNCDAKTTLFITDCRSELVNMSQKFNIGVNRTVAVKKQNDNLTITISEQGTDKLAEFTAQRWRSLYAGLTKSTRVVKRLRRNST